MGTPVLYHNFKLKQHNGNQIDLDTEVIKVMITTSAYTPNAATHAFKSDVTNEVSGTNYTARGETIAGSAVALDGATVEWSHNDITWLQNAGGFSNGRTFVWYQDTGVDGTSKLIMYMTEGADFGNVSGDLTLDADAATGVLQFT